MAVILAILQARMSSTRLPGKVLKTILGRPMLELQIERIRRCKKIDCLIVATSINPEDDPLEILCRKIDIPCFRGDLENVLDRFYQASRQYNAQHIVRLTGDCPLADPVLIDVLIDFYMAQGCDYASNCHEPTLPDGLDAEVFSCAVLTQAWNEAVLPSHLEHVTPFIRAHPERFKISCYKYPKDLSHYRWVVDEPADLDFAKKIFENLYPLNLEFGMGDILTLLDKMPELLEINQQFRRNEGEKKSIGKDAHFFSGHESNVV